MSLGEILGVTNSREEGTTEHQKAGASGTVRPGERVLKVDNLAPNVDWKELKDICKRVGPVQFVDLPEKEGEPLGYALVRFAREEDISKAINSLQGLNVGGRNIQVREVTS